MNEPTSGASRDPDAIHDVIIVLAPPDQERRGLLAYATMLTGGWRISGIRLRLGADDRLYLSFPEHRSAGGFSDPYVVPVDDAVRARLTSAVIDAYVRARAPGGLPSERSGIASAATARPLAKASPDRPPAVDADPHLTVCKPSVPRSEDAA